MGSRWTPKAGWPFKVVQNGRKRTKLCFFPLFWSTLGHGLASGCISFPWLRARSRKVHRCEPSAADVPGSWEVVPWREKEAGGASTVVSTGIHLWHLSDLLGYQGKFPPSGNHFFRILIALAPIGLASAESYDLQAWQPYLLGSPSLLWVGTL